MPFVLLLNFITVKLKTRSEITPDACGLKCPLDTVMKESRAAGGEEREPERQHVHVHPTRPGCSSEC